MNHLHSVNCLPILSKPDLQCAYIQPAEGPDHCPCSSTAGTRQAGPRTMDMQFAKVKPGDSLALSIVKENLFALCCGSLIKNPHGSHFFSNDIYIGNLSNTVWRIFSAEAPPPFGTIFLHKKFLWTVRQFVLRKISSTRATNGVLH